MSQNLKSIISTIKNMDELYEDEETILKRLQDKEKENQESIARLQKAEQDALQLKKQIEANLESLNNENINSP